MQRKAPDFLFLFLTLIFTAFGLVMVFSASHVIAYKEYGDAAYFLKRQAMWAGLGIIVMIVVMNIRPRFFKRITPFLLLTVFLLLFTVYIPGIGVELNGSRSWIRVSGFSLQPGEAIKPALILYIAYLLEKKGEGVRNFKNGLMPPLIVTASLVLPVVLQNDLGTAMIALMTVMVMLFVGGARFLHMLVLGVGAAVFAGIFILLFSYRLKRITAFLDPWQDPLVSGYQLIQSLYAIAHGGLYGSGLKSIQQFFYLPFPYNDFIFAIIAEQLGFIGAGTFIVLYALWILQGILISVKSGDFYSQLIGIGSISAIAIQAIINIGGVTGMLPITGVTLPLISYGGSSMIVTFFLSGLILGISRSRRERQKDRKKSAMPVLKHATHLTSRMN
ncbi:MAG: Cell division protein FtsW [Candidatus Carbobacillus altaicus]|uniref:Probable peptidoglycan glycosyltransferase FtsW n=1 Tax=Candidatus Carbonibacillus altaicus TaxID=2163959 RepID=A0A2R6Y1E9_9BACL|nr:MAG: Cell division protein FtsW [Candidatus Carbobacillus altaicus]